MKFLRVVVIGAALALVASYLFTGLSDCLRTLIRTAKPEVGTEAGVTK